MDNGVIPKNTYREHEIEPYAQIRRTGNKIHIVIMVKPTGLLSYENNVGIERLRADSIFMGQIFLLKDIFYAASANHMRIDFYFEVPER